MATWGKRDAVSTDAGVTPLDELFDSTHQRLTRLRHQPDDATSHPAVTASIRSVEYIQAFWPHVVAAVRSDPAKLGLSFVAPIEGQHQRVSADTMLEAFVNDPANAADPQLAQRRGAILSSQAVMSQVLNSAVAEWAADFEGDAPRCPLDFEVNRDDYVSLRMLLPRRDGGSNNVSGNAPTLVMGGTATAITLCWNLLDQIPRCYAAMKGVAPSREVVEQIWHDTRELFFRIGSGSLTAFVALASGCASQSEAMIWDGANDLCLTEREGGYMWAANDSLVARYRELESGIEADQQGHYVGCAALYARASALPLAPQWADEIDGSREQIVFAELLRWITAVARRQYFSAFD